jgi:S1-C subfamily serine protease
VHEARLGEMLPGNMFVPVDLLVPILADLLADGRPEAPPHPWLGMNTEPIGTTLVVTRVAPDGPAAAAGIERGDVVERVGARAVDDLADLYRKVWALGPAGVTVPLSLRRGHSSVDVEVHSIDRQRSLKTQTY